jgi:quinol-cytochrome oxidoreductase complex cytochrome b subunit
MYTFPSNYLSKSHFIHMTNSIDKLQNWFRLLLNSFLCTSATRRDNSVPRNNEQGWYNIGACVTYVDLWLMIPNTQLYFYPWLYHSDVSNSYCRWQNKYILLTNVFIAPETVLHIMITCLQQKKKCEKNKIMLSNLC